MRTRSASTTPVGGEPFPDFDTFYRDVAPWAIRRLVLGGSTEQEAEDVVQEAMTEMLRTWPDHLAYTPEQRAAHLLRGATWKARDLARRGRRLRNLFPRLWQRDDAPAPEDRGPGTALGFVRRLPERQRAVLMLTSDGYAIAEIADLMRVSPSTVSSHLAAARKALRGHLGVPR
ncbi:RNA polymerase sigma factor [Actinoplanes sp. HUAS TT8]|uniref:RNA polymerase sigma factor n=1 Tax=Actinoplanes sp. HUAS TT8 TaxID=3447453 RepID=UPI003F522871